MTTPAASSQSEAHARHGTAVTHRAAPTSSRRQEEATPALSSIVGSAHRSTRHHHPSYCWILLLFFAAAILHLRLSLHAISPRLDDSEILVTILLLTIEQHPAYEDAARQPKKRSSAVNCQRSSSGSTEKSSGAYRPSGNPIPIESILAFERPTFPL